MATDDPAANVVCAHKLTEISSALRVCMTEKQCVLGGGSFGKVYRGQCCIDKIWREVAVKIIENSNETTKKEIEIWRDNNLQHENILFYLGMEVDSTTSTL